MKTKSLSDKLQLKMFQQFSTTSIKKKLLDLSKQIFPKAKLINFKMEDVDLKSLDQLFTKSIRTAIVDNLNLEKGDVVLLSYGSKLDAVS